jgi:hypothetical protein
MRWMRWALVVAVCAVSLAVPGDAFAKEIIINPPGSAGANEYSEVIPSSAGNVAPPSGGPSSPTSGSLASLSRGRVGATRLDRLGKDGQAAAAFAAASAPARVPASPSAAGLGGPPNAGTPASSGSAVSGLSRALTGSDAGGLGLLLPLLLATALVGAIGIAGWRVRRRPQPSQLGA